MNYRRPTVPDNERNNRESRRATTAIASRRGWVGPVEQGMGFTRTRVQANSRAPFGAIVLVRITRGRFFFITVRADCIFYVPPRARGCPIRRIAWKKGHLITCSWQSCPASTLPAQPPVPPQAELRNPAILDGILAESRGERRRGVPFIRGPQGRSRSLYASSFFSPSLRPLRFLLRRRPPAPFHHPGPGDASSIGLSRPA